MDLGNRSILYNFVETPALLPLPVSLPSPSPSPPAAFDDFQSSGTWNSKPEVSLFLSATVYDHAVTEIRWWREEGEYVIWSSADFNLLRGTIDFETPQVRYSIFLGIGNESRAEIEQWNAYVLANRLAPDLRRRVPAIQALSPGRSNHRIVSPPKFGTRVEALRTLEEIHRYYDANRVRLAHEYQESEAARIAQEDWQRQHPPVPKDTTINFFPIKSAYREGQGSAEHEP